MVDVCVFDKTGTLISDKMVLNRIRFAITGDDGKLAITESLVLPSRGSSYDEYGGGGDKGHKEGSTNSQTAPPNVICVMVGCQSLASLSGYNTKSDPECA